jgi:hypothetical protein
MMANEAAASSQASSHLRALQVALRAVGQQRGAQLQLVVAGLLEGAGVRAHGVAAAPGVVVRVAGGVQLGGGDVAAAALGGRTRLGGGGAPRHEGRGTARRVAAEVLGVALCAGPALGRAAAAAALGGLGARWRRA